MNLRLQSGIIAADAAYGERLRAHAAHRLAFAVNNHRRQSLYSASRTIFGRGRVHRGSTTGGAVTS